MTTSRSMTSWLGKAAFGISAFAIPSSFLRYVRVIAVIAGESRAPGFPTFSIARL